MATTRLAGVSICSGFDGRYSAEVLAEFRKIQRAVFRHFPREEDQLLVDILLSEAIKTSEIEGEYLSRVDVMSSLKKNLGIHEEQPKLMKDHRAKGIAKLMVAVRQ